MSGHLELRTVTVVRSHLLWILVTALALLEEHRVSLTAELHLYPYLIILKNISFIISVCMCAYMHVWHVLGMLAYHRSHVGVTR